MKEVKSAWISKINWTQAMSFLAMIFTMFGIDLPAELQAQIVTGIGIVAAVVTWILRTWFTTAITFASEQRQ